MRVMGHVPSAVGLEHVIEAHQESIEHLDGLAAAAQAEGSPQIGKISFRTEPNAWPYVDDKKVAELARREIEAGTWNCPTLVVYQKWVTGDERTKSLAGPYMKYVSPLMRSAWGPTEANEKWMSADFVGASHVADPRRMRAVGVLHKAGARILLGTDQANPFVIAGFAVHEELANLVAAGLSPYEALRAGTSGAAEFMHASDEWGTVAVGRRADLLLLEKNPLEAVANAKTPLGVMVRGRWLPRAELDESLEKLAKEYAK
jgi:imidazolonepropionase-like amidohydrolase